MAQHHSTNFLAPNIFLSGAVDHGLSPWVYTDTEEPGLNRFKSSFGHWNL